MKYPFLLILSFLFNNLLSAQVEKAVSAADILHEMEKLRNTTRVLYVAAHPDDENTRLISYLVNGKKVETAYLSLTRGDGGQNVIGSELREGLGLIRTQELLAARKIDGGKQFFTRANDFGFSKNPNETFNKWGKEEVLADVVWTIRNFQPDIIITRFNQTPGITHGHHTASAILANEAFHKAADPKAYPEQLEYTKAWQAKKIYWNTSSWFFSRNEDFDRSKYIIENVGDFNPILGTSYTEMAALSRSRHKSQAFGSSGSRGDELEYFEQWEAEKASKLFEGIDSMWSNYENGQAILKQINQIIDSFDPHQPYLSVSDLLKLRKQLNQLDPSAVKSSKIQQVEDIIMNCLGLYKMLSYNQPYASPSDRFLVNLELVNRSPLSVELKEIIIEELDVNKPINQSLKNNEAYKTAVDLSIPADFNYSNPYWLNNESYNGLYEVKDQLLIGKAENDPSIQAHLVMQIEGEELELMVPLNFKENDRINGEIIQPFHILPAASIEFDEDVSIFTQKGETKSLKIKVKALKDNLTGELQFSLPTGWKINGQNDLKIENLALNNTQSFEIQLSSGDDIGAFELQAILTLENGKRISESVQRIEYDHIPNQVIIRTAKQKLVLADVKIAGKRIGYIPGAGDGVGDGLKAMGYLVQEINIENISEKELFKFDAIVAGIRAYNTNTDLQNNYKKLLPYMEQGGVYMVQYNTTYSLPNTDFWPYPMQLSRDRITVEESKISFTNPKHPALNYPNKITESDFSGWVQERGLYFPGQWSSDYQTIISGHDPDEEPTEGAILIAAYGKGRFVYTGLSFFREIPAGVPGAYRMLANLLAKP